MADCPGFGDTRGDGEFELCTNISIDQTVQRSRSLLSLVIVLPVTAFLLDRGNPVIDLINSIRERFPDTFDPDKPEANAHVHLLLTKQGHVKADVVASMKDGRRFEAYARESDHPNNPISGPEQSSIGFMEPTQKRQHIWRSILQIYQSGRVHFIDIRDQQARKELLESFSRHGCFNKQQYIPAMATDHMHKKFGDSVQMATHAWISLIFGKFLRTLPEELHKANEVLNQRRSSLAQNEVEREKQCQKIQALEENSKELNALIKRLQGNEETVIDDALKQELLAATAASVQSLAQQQLSALEEVKANIESKKSALAILETDIQTSTENMEAAIASIVELKEKVKLLEIGPPYTSNLYQKEWRADEEVQMYSLKPGALERAHEELRPMADEDLEKVEYSGLAKNYKGLSVGIANIKRGYRLVPADEIERSTFFNTNNAGGFVAAVKGKKLKFFGYGPRASTDGKTISYAYSLEWDGTTNLPNISIDFTVPLREYNYAEIVGLQTEIGEAEMQIQTLRLHLNGNEKLSGAIMRKKIISDEIETLQGKQRECEQRIEELRNDQVLKQVQEMLESTTKSLDAVEAEKKQLEDFTVIDRRIGQLKREIEEAEQTIMKLRKNRRNLAIVIKTEWESAKLLREFADHVVAQGQHLTKTVETCSEYITLFDQHKNTSLQMIQDEYRF